MGPNGVEVHLVIPAAPSSTPAPVATPTVAVPRRPTPPALAHTGADVLVLAALAGLLILMGLVLLTRSQTPRRSS
jgi:CHASE1-domain containing sensor protein